MSVAHDISCGHTTDLGELYLLTVSQRKLDLSDLSVTDCSLCNLPLENFYCLGLGCVSRKIECPLTATLK